MSTYTDEEMKWIKEAMTFVWKDAHELAIALDGMDLTQERIEHMSRMWELIPQEDLSALEKETACFLATYDEPIQEYVIENDLWR